MSAATPAEWGAAVSFAVMVCAPVGGLFLLTVDADVADFDPRPAFRRQVAAGRFDPLLIAVVNARHSARTFLRDAAVTAAALLMLATASEATR